jgi:hypothetical protein
VTGVVKWGYILNHDNIQHSSKRITSDGSSTKKKKRLSLTMFDADKQKILSLINTKLGPLIQFLWPCWYQAHCAGIAFQEEHKKQPRKATARQPCKYSRFEAGNNTNKLITN